MAEITQQDWQKKYTIGSRYDSFALGARIYDREPLETEVAPTKNAETRYSLSLERDNIRVAMTNEGGHQSLAIGITVDKETTVLVLNEDQEKNLMELYHSLRAKRP